MKISDSWSSGPIGDQSTSSIIFTPTDENIALGYESGNNFLVIGSSQLWNSNPTVSSSICISHEDVRISGDMYAVGADATHRHLVTATAVWSAP